jgi:hypothetical protein
MESRARTTVAGRKRMYYVLEDFSTCGYLVLCSLCSLRCTGIFKLSSTPISISNSHHSNSLDFLMVATGRILITVEFVKLRLLQALLAQDDCLDPVRHDGSSLVLHVRASRNSKHVIEFFERSLLRLDRMLANSESLVVNAYLWEPQQNHDECDSVQTSVESECTLWRKGLQHTWESQRQD